MRFVLPFLILAAFEAHAWDFKAFGNNKLQLAGGSLTPPPGTAGIFAKAHPDFPLLILVDKKCLSSRAPSAAQVLAGLEFQTQHKNSGGLVIEAIAARYLGSLSPAQLESKLAAQPCIAGVTENPSVTSQAVNDPLYVNQPALPSISQIQGERFFFHPLWGIRRDVTVAVVDSGAQLNHPDLLARVWRGPDGFSGFDFVNGDNDPSDDFGHGTHVAGIVLAQKDNGVGVRGVMGDWSKLMAVKSQDAGGGGTMADVINAFRWAVDHGAEVVNLSLASRLQNQALVDALDYAVNHNVTVVVAAGNDGEQITSNNFISPIGYAADFAGVIGVGSFDANSKLRSAFSNYAPLYVEIAAPGSPGSNAGILSTFPNGQYSGINGTSMSAPHVAGAAALATGFLKTHSIAYTPEQIEQLILGSADRNSANQTYFSEGRALNLENLGRYIFNSTFVNSTGGFDEP